MLTIFPFQVNFNGHITFGARWRTQDPFTVNTTSPSVLAIFNVFYSDNDPRRFPGLIYSRVTTRPEDLNLANSLIRGQGFTTFSSSYCIIATFENLKYYVADENERFDPAFFEQNTYQITLCTDGVDGHYIYQYNKLEWGRSQDITTNFATVSSYLFCFVSLFLPYRTKQYRTKVTKIMSDQKLCPNQTFQNKPKID